MDEEAYHQLIEEITFNQIRRLSIQATYPKARYLNT